MGEVKVASLCLGIMRSRMAANLLRAGHELCVWLRATEKTRALGRDAPVVGATGFSRETLLDFSGVSESLRKKGGTTC